MKPCVLTITTTADDVENTIVREGEIELSPICVLLCYREENAFVCMKLQGESAEIERQGDYTLRLSLKKDEICEGELGIGGTGGLIQTFTHRIAYSVSKDSLLLSLHYDLIIGGERQKMKIRLLGRLKQREEGEKL